VVSGTHRKLSVSDLVFAGACFFRTIAQIWEVAPSMTSQTSVEMEKDIRTQGLIGVILLLITLVMFVYRTGVVDGQSYKGVAVSAGVALQAARSNVQGLFDEQGSERNIALMKKRATFGWDFVPAWMCFIFFLQRVILRWRPSGTRGLWCAGLILIFTFITNNLLAGYIATAERQAVTDAEWNRIVFFGQVKWAFLFIDAFLAGLSLFLTPPILRVGAILLAASACGAFVGFAIPSGLLVSYCVVGMFLAFTGISMLLLFQPQLLFWEAKLPDSRTEE
jgi:hypothetical protein